MALVRGSISDFLLLPPFITERLKKLIEKRLEITPKHRPFNLFSKIPFIFQSTRRTDAITYPIRLFPLPEIEASRHRPRRAPSGNEATKYGFETEPFDRKDATPPPSSVCQWLGISSKRPSLANCSQTLTRDAILRQRADDKFVNSSTATGMDEEGGTQGWVVALGMFWERLTCGCETSKVCTDRRLKPAEGPCSRIGFVLGRVYLSIFGMCAFVCTRRLFCENG